MQVKFINEVDFLKYKFKTKPYKHQYDAFLNQKIKNHTPCLWNKELESLK